MVNKYQFQKMKASSFLFFKIFTLKDMLKYTPVDHPDYGNLQLALEEIKTLADRMNKGEMEADQAERHNERIRDIENTIEGIVDLVSSNRRFIRQDLVAESRSGVTKKDRCLFLFSDLLVCTTVRRKNNALRRGSIGLFTGQSAADINRFKFLWKLPLDNIDVVKGVKIFLRFYLWFCREKTATYRLHSVCIAFVSIIRLVSENTCFQCQL